MDFKALIGVFAATFTTIAFIPQVIQIIKSRNTEGISLPMYIIFTTGIGCWLVYGILSNDIPLIAANSITLILAGIILFFKIKHG
jgi:MtN3 and saliva related transmembrane protein